MSHCPECRHAVVTVAQGAGGAAAPAYVRGARPEYGAVRPLGAARAELHDRPALRGVADAVGLCRYEALVVYGKQYHRFNKLRLYDRAAHCNYGLAGENGHTLRYRPHVAYKFKVFKVAEEAFAEHFPLPQV